MKCTCCGKKITKKLCVSTRLVQNEGSSEIQLGDKIFSVDDATYCDLDCLFNDIKKSLDPKKPTKANKSHPDGYRIQERPSKYCGVCSHCESRIQSSQLVYPPGYNYNCDLIEEKDYGYSGNVSEMGVCDRFKLSKDLK